MSPVSRPVSRAARAPDPALATVRVSEIFLSLQGEGPSAGTPAHFLRLQGCTVGCVWCDTKYAWSAAGGREVAIGSLLDELRGAHAGAPAGVPAGAPAGAPAEGGSGSGSGSGEVPLLVVTGGEPLETPALASLLDLALARWERVEVETSGLLPPPISRERLCWIVSPKLPRATPRWEETWRHASAWLAEPRATFKIVVGDDPDEADALRRIAAHGLPVARVMLMPEGVTDAALRERAVRIAETCKRHGFRLSPRLHVWMWGAKRGV
ncbi:MAG TPA: 7-carboxy-7-deazaguanine synthase QueE [Terriglobales bacterium]|nr:7-carboxy-7-deazaguanine synthase QueE [Terriglobales bacterium]